MSHSLSTRRVSAVSYNTKQCIGMNLHIQTTPTLKLMSRKPKVLFTRHHRWFSRQSYIYYEITLLSPRNYDVWGMSIAISYWWLVNTQVWIMLLIGWGQIPTRHNKSEVLPRSAYWTSSEWNFCPRSSDLISRENRWWRSEMSSVFFGYLKTTPTRNNNIWKGL